MIKTLQTNFVSFLCRTFVMASVGSLFGAVAVQAEDTNATVMKPVLVTGSYIPTAESVGPAPVETITPEQIQRTGGGDILTTLKFLSTSFSGGNNIGQALNNGGFG